MDWLVLNSLSQLEDIKNASKEKPVFIFKHSTRCSVSGMALERMKRNWKKEDFNRVTPYFLDLIGYREISNRIEEEFSIDHESPQIILIKDEKVVYENSHLGINYLNLMEEVENNRS